MEMDKRVFSLNLICFLRCHGVKEKSVGFNENTKKVFYVYEATDEVKEIMNRYLDKETEIKLHMYIREFKQLREELLRYSKEFKNN